MFGRVTFAAVLTVALVAAGTLPAFAECAGSHPTTAEPQPKDGPVTTPVTS